MTTLRIVTDIDENNESISYTYGPNNTPAVESFSNILSSNIPCRYNIDNLPTALENFFLAKFFHQKHVLITSHKPDSDTVVTIPDAFLTGTVPTQQEIDTAPATTANDKQIGGTHYKQQTIEPWDFSIANNLDGMQFNVVKYITRYKTKHHDPLVDLRKAQHYIEKMIEVEQQRQQETAIDLWNKEQFEKHNTPTTPSTPSTPTTSA